MKNHLPQSGAARWLSLLILLLALAFVWLTVAASPVLGSRAAQTTAIPSVTPTPSPTTANELARLQAQLDVSEGRRLVAQAELLRRTNRALSMLLVAEANRRVENAETRNAILSALNTNLDSTLYYSQRGIMLLAYSDATNLVAGAGRGGNIFLWDSTSGQLAGELLTSPVGRITALAFSPDGKTLASGGAKGAIRLWDVETQVLRDTVLTGHTNEVRALSFSFDGKILTSSSDDRTVRRWDTMTGKIIGNPFVIGVPIKLLLSSPDGNSFIANDTLWDAATHKHDIHAVGESVTPTSLAFSPNGALVAFLDDLGGIHVWDAVANKTVLRAPIPGATLSPLGLAFSADGQLLTVVKSLTETYTVQARTGKEVPNAARLFAAGTTLPLMGQGTLLPWAPKMGTVEFWAVATDTVWTAPLNLPGDANDPRFSADGKWLVAACSASSDGGSCSPNQTVLWDTQKRVRAVPPLSTNRTDFAAFALSTDSTQLAFTNCGSFETVTLCSRNEINIWDLVQGKLVGAPIPTAHAVTAIVWLENKQLAYADTANVIQIYDFASQKIVASLKGHTNPILSLAVTADGKHLASGGQDATVRLWDLDTNTAQVLSGHTNIVYAVLFSHNDKTLASASSDGTVRLWNVASGTLIGAPLASNKPVYALAFNGPDTLLAAGHYNNFTLWDVRQQKPIRQWDAVLGIETDDAPSEHLFQPVVALAFQSNDRELWSVIRGGVIRQTQVSTLVASSIERLCLKVNRNLTREEWTQYLANGSDTYENYRAHPTCPNAPDQE